MEKYIKSQRELRSAIEEVETKTIENRLEKLYEKAKINPNTIWAARKRANGCQDLDYNTYTEEGKLITNPEETKDHIANYFEELYQAREGTENYSEWTKKIKEHVRSSLEEPPMDNNPEDKINEKEFNQAIKKAKKKQEFGPRQNTKWTIHWSKQTNKGYTKRNNRECTPIRDYTPQLGGRRNHKTIQGQRSKRKMLKWKRHNTSQQCRKGLRENHQQKSEERRQYHKGPSRWKTRMLHGGPPHSPETNDQRNHKQRTYSLHNIPGCAKSIRQSVAGCNTICAKQEWNPRKKSEDNQKTQLQSQSQNSNKIRTNQKNWNKRQYQTRVCAIGHRIRHLNWWNRKRAQTPKARLRSNSKYNTGLATMDGWCLPNTPRPREAPGDIRCHKPCSQQIPHPVRSSQMQSN